MHLESQTSNDDPVMQEIDVLTDVVKFDKLSDVHSFIISVLFGTKIYLDKNSTTIDTFIKIE